MHHRSGPSRRSSLLTVATYNVSFMFLYNKLSVALTLRMLRSKVESAIKIIASSTGNGRRPSLVQSALPDGSGEREVSGEAHFGKAIRNVCKRFGTVQEESGLV